MQRPVLSELPEALGSLSAERPALSFAKAGDWLNLPISFASSPKPTLANLLLSLFEPVMRGSNIFLAVVVK